MLQERMPAEWHRGGLTGAVSSCSEQPAAPCPSSATSREVAAHHMKGGQWLEGAAACVQDNGSTRHHQNQHKIKTRWAVCSDPPSCPGPRPSYGQLEAKGGRLRQPNCRGCGEPRQPEKPGTALPSLPSFPASLSPLLPPPHQQAYLSSQELIKALHPAKLSLLLWDKP